MVGQQVKRNNEEKEEESEYRDWKQEWDGVVIELLDLWVIGVTGLYSEYAHRNPITGNHTPSRTGRTLNVSDPT